MKTFCPRSKSRMEKTLKDDMHYAYYVNIITMQYATVQIGLIQSKLWVHLCSWLARLHQQSIWRRRLLPQFLSRAFLCLQQRLFAPSPPLSGLEHRTATKAHFRVLRDQSFRLVSFVALSSTSRSLFQLISLGYVSLLHIEP